MKRLSIKKQLILIAALSLLLPSLGTAGGFSWTGNLPRLNVLHASRPTESEDMSVDLAKELANKYVEERFTNSDKIGEIEDRGTHYSAEILGSDSNVKEVVVIDKQTQKIQPLKETLFQTGIHLGGGPEEMSGALSPTLFERGYMLLKIMTKDLLPLKTFVRGAD